MAGFDWRARLREGVVIPAHPLVLTKIRGLDEKRQSRLTRYYVDAGAAGIAVGVHTTQSRFAKRECMSRCSRWPRTRRTAAM
jgi:hypothetical protein